MAEREQFNIPNFDERIKFQKNTDYFLPSGAQLFLPEDDPEKAQKILDAKTVIHKFQQQGIKENLDPISVTSTILNYIDSEGLTREEVSGRYQSSWSAKSKAFVNAVNTGFADILGGIIESQGAYVGPGAVDIKNELYNQSLISEEELNETFGREEMLSLFEAMNAIDPTFTPKTMGERIADQAGSSFVTGVMLAVPGSQISKANYLKTLGGKGVLNNIRNTTYGAINNIIEIYKKSVGKEGVKGGFGMRAMFDDILAATGFGAGMQITKEMKGEDTIIADPEREGIIPSFQEAAYETFLPFGVSVATMAAFNPYNLPAATYNSLKEIPTLGSRFANWVQGKLQSKAKQDVSNELKESFELQASNLTSGKSGEMGDIIIKSDKEIDRILEQIPGLKFTLAQITENVSLAEQQRAIEAALLAESKKFPELTREVQQQILKNYSIVGKQIDDEFKQTINVLDEEGNILETVDNKPFHSYINENKDIVVKAADEKIDETIAKQTEQLVPGSTVPKQATTESLAASGEKIRKKVIDQKQDSRNTYENLIFDTLPNKTFDVTSLKDDIIVNYGPTAGEDQRAIPFIYNQFKDLGNEFQPIISNFKAQADAAYAKYLDGSLGPDSYKKYIEQIYKLQSSFNKAIDNKNIQLQSQAISGEKPFLAQYDIGDLSINLPPNIKVQTLPSGKLKITGINPAQDKGKFYLGREGVDLDTPGAEITFSFNPPKLEANTKDMVNIMRNIDRQLEVAMRDPSNINEDLIRRLTQIKTRVQKEFTDNIDNTPNKSEYLKALNQYDEFYKIPFETGAIRQVVTGDGSIQYLQTPEIVGQSFLKDSNTVRQFFKIFAPDGPQNKDVFDNQAIEGLTDSFFDTMYKKVLNNEGVIDISKLQKFKQDNQDVINIITEYVPNVGKAINDQVELGLKFANRLNKLEQQKSFAGRIELNKFAKEGGFEGVSYKSVDDLMKQVMKDPNQMSIVVKALSSDPENEAMFQSFKNAVFSQWTKAARKTKGSTKIPRPDEKKMAEWLSNNKSIIDAFYKAQGDEGGYQRLKTVTDAIAKLNLTGFPSAPGSGSLDAAKNIFGTGIPQILSRVYAVEGGRTSLRYIGSDLFLRMMHTLRGRQKEKIMAQALYNPDFASELLNLTKSNGKLSAADLDKLKGYLGKITGFIDVSIDDAVEQQNKEDGQAMKEDEQAINEKIIEDQSRIMNIAPPSLSIPQVSPASSLASVNMAGLVTPNTMPGNISRGQQIFGATDPIFGGINSVS